MCVLHPLSETGSKQCIESNVQFNDVNHIKSISIIKSLLKQVLELQDGHIKGAQAIIGASGDELMTDAI